MTRDPQWQPCPHPPFVHSVGLLCTAIFVRLSFADCHYMSNLLAQDTLIMRIAVGLIDLSAGHYWADWVPSGSNSRPISVSARHGSSVPDWTVCVCHCVRKSSWRSSGPSQPATWSYHAADCQPTAPMLSVSLVQSAGMPYRSSDLSFDCFSLDTS